MLHSLSKYLIGETTHDKIFYYVIIWMFAELHEKSMVFKTLNCNSCDMFCEMSLKS